jgi:hypothetical protein
MAEMTIQLKCDPVTGKKDIIVSLRGDSDELPHEHEQRHRRLVEKLIEGGLLQASEVGKVIVEREEEAGKSIELPQSPESQRTAQSQGE